MADISRAERWRHGFQWAGLIAGPVLAVLVYVLLASGGDLDHPGRLAAALAVWMAVWWMTEAVAVYATALLPLAVLPLGGALPIKEVASQYAHELIFLFMGGFLLALAMERWGLHRRIALTSLRVVGTRPIMIVAGFMGTTALMSMWVSNTATSITMLPIAMSLVDLYDRSVGKDSPGRNRFAVCLLLGIAYAASIGGLGTIIGSPPNLFVVSYMKQDLGVTVSFVRWMIVGVPLVIVFLPIAWVVLTRFAFPLTGMPAIAGGAAYLREALTKLGRMKSGEWIVLIAFSLTALAWITRPLLARWEVGGIHPLAGLSDSGIAMLTALCLFIIPVDLAKREFVLDWPTAVKLPWGVLVLFGGGLSLAYSLDHTGVSVFLGEQAENLAGLPNWLLIMLVVTMVIFLTELTSNLATAAALVPVLAAISGGLGVEPVALIVPAAMAASCAFMLPVATPPNAVVFGTGRVGIGEMIRAGMWLNVIGVFLVSLAAYALILPLFIQGGWYEYYMKVYEYFGGSVAP